MKKNEKLKVKKTIKNFLNRIYKWTKKFIKFVDSEIKKYKFHQYKNPTAKDNIDVNEIVIFYCACIFFQKWVHIEEILINLNICLFW